MRAQMVRTLVRWGGEAAEHLAYKSDDEIRGMVDSLKMRLEVGCADGSPAFLYPAGTGLMAAVAAAVGG